MIWSAPAKRGDDGAFLWTCDQRTLRESKAPSPLRSAGALQFYCVGVGVCFVTVFTVGEACGGGSLFTDGDAFGVGDSLGTFAFLFDFAEGLGSAPKFPLMLAGGNWPL